MTVRCTVVLLFLTGLSGFRSTSDSWGGVAIERRTSAIACTW
jgi:hypothetical protein